MLAIRSWLRTHIRIIIAIIFLISIALALAGARARVFPLWEGHLNPDSDTSLANAFSVVLWLLVATLAGALAKRGHARLGWLSVAVLAASVAIGEVSDFKDALVPFFPALSYGAWIAVIAPIALPLLFFAARTLWSAVQSPTQRVLLVASGIFAAAPLVLDEVSSPISLAEEGSELMAAAVLIALLASVLGWVPLAPAFLTWRFVAIVAAPAVLAAGILGAREYEIRVAGAGGDRPEVDHGPLTSVSQTLTVDRAHLSRIDVWVGSTGSAADLLLRVALPGQPPIRESRATTRYPRWSDQPVTFTFAPIPDSQGQTYEITIGALQPWPYVFLGLSTDDPIPESVVQINGIPDPWENDLSLRAYTPGRGLVAFVAMIQDRPYKEVMISVEALMFWLWIVVIILWLRASRTPKSGVGRLE